MIRQRTQFEIYDDLNKIIKSGDTLKNRMYKTIKTNYYHSDLKTEFKIKFDENNKAYINMNKICNKFSFKEENNDDLKHFTRRILAVNGSDKYVDYVHKNEFNRIYINNLNVGDYIEVRFTNEFKKKKKRKVKICRMLIKIISINENKINLKFFSNNADFDAELKNTRELFFKEIEYNRATKSISDLYNKTGIVLDMRDFETYCEIKNKCLELYLNFKFNGGVICYAPDGTVEVFDSIQDASDATNINCNTIISNLDGITKLTKDGYKFKYNNNEK